MFQGTLGGNGEQSHQENVRQQFAAGEPCSGSEVNIDVCVRTHVSEQPLRVVQGDCWDTTAGASWGLRPGSSQAQTGGHLCSLAHSDSSLHTANRCPERAEQHPPGQSGKRKQPRHQKGWGAALKRDAQGQSEGQDETDGGGRIAPASKCPGESCPPEVDPTPR
ncbi:unnamed protein product [Gulo gulo]|uniref:Uncharacterized protein n=1 Tax=Gulo gulo TaxID=48420 RepID=A0A9X9LNN1_GULGU|nr:unnamed protein product [Gulo gulo]